MSRELSPLKQRLQSKRTGAAGAKSRASVDALATLAVLLFSPSSAAPRAVVPAPKRAVATPRTEAAPAAALPLLGVAFVYSDFVHETGWTFAHDRARKAVEAEFGSRIGMTWVEDVPTDKDADRILKLLAKRGIRLIFETSPGFSSPMMKAAKENPKVRFEHARGTATTANLRTYDARAYEGAYLAGVIAGGMTKTNKLGVVASLPTADVICDIDSFTLGAQSINPKVETAVVWVNRQFDPAKEAESARILLNGGADVLMQTTDSAAVLQAAEKAGKLALGWQSDMSKLGPKAHLASVVINWTPYYTKVISETLAGTAKTRQTWWGVKEGAIDLVSVSSLVPLSLKQAAETAIKGLRKGTLAIWKGPIVDQTGKTVLKANQIAKDEFLRTIDFYVRGVSGTLPREQ